jgi:hypothetical protein
LSIAVEPAQLALTLAAPGDFVTAPPQAAPSSEKPQLMLDGSRAQQPAAATTERPTGSAVLIIELA